MELSFGEQIKILLKRRNMSIQDLAALYEARTGQKMSRQNLTQRLNRDNFPEQDMRILAAVLGYQVSVQLTPSAVPVSDFPHLESAPAPANTLPVTDTVRTSPQTPTNEMPMSDISSTISGKSEDSSTDTDSSNGMVFKIPKAFRKVQPKGDINPLTGEEYLTNTVRRHPQIEEYLQVYDQATHEWADVREDYFLEFQESKKRLLGKDYQ